MKKRLLSVIVALTLVFTVIPSFASAATSQGSFWGDGTYVGNVGATKDDGYTSEVQSIKFTNRSGATYSAVSDNSKVVKVTGIKIGYDEVAFTDNGKVLITGTGVGTANITLKETINGKTKVAGKAKVTIVRATIGTHAENTNHVFGLGEQPSYLKIENRNTGAVYSFKSNKPGLTLYTKKENAVVSVRMNATAYGTYTVSAYETINGKARKLKDMTFTVKATLIPDSIAVSGNTSQLKDSIKFIDTNYDYSVSIKGQDVFKKTGSSGSSYVNRNPESNKTFEDYTVFNVSNVDDELMGYLVANKSATVTANVYRKKVNATETDKAEFVKTIKITFKF